MKEADWNDFLHQLNNIESIDDLWATINAVELAARMPKGCRYYIFKKGVRPLWEDRANQNGSEISIEHPTVKAKRQKITDRWMDVVLSVLGESIAESDAINGIEFTVRASTFKISLWVADSPEPTYNTIKNELQKIVNWTTQAKITPIQLK